jgi:hypothetical protein
MLLIDGLALQQSGDAQRHFCSSFLNEDAGQQCKPNQRADNSEPKLAREQQSTGRLEGLSVAEFVEHH